MSDQRKDCTICEARGILNHTDFPSANYTSSSAFDAATTTENTPKPRDSSTSLGTSQELSTTDVTLAFAEAAGALRTGQLVKDEFFTLFEAVGALEIMDSKMDSGHLELGETLEDQYNVLRPLMPEEVIGIMDQLLCHEVAWHIGHPLCQTLFTSIYINRLLWPEPPSLEQSQFHQKSEAPLGGPLVQLVLRSFCLGTIKACDFVLRMVTSEHFYEEEDFATQLYHRDLLRRFETDDIQLLLDDALSWLAGADMNYELKLGIERRLILRQELLIALEADISSLYHGSTASLACIPLLQEIKKSNCLGKPVPESFSPKIQRTLASSVPPRPMVMIDFAEALAHLEETCRNASNVGQILMVEGNENMLTAFSVFMSQKPQPSVYIRALVQSLISRDEGPVGKLTLKNFIFNDLESLVLPDSLLLRLDNDKVEIPSDERFQMVKCLDEFVSRCGQSYLNIFRTTCLNRCRVRRTLCHAVTEWDNLQAEAEELDATLRAFTKEAPTAYLMGTPPTYSYPLSSWTYHYKLQQLELIIQLGFELSIYAPDELPQMYWFLSHVCTLHLSQLDRMSFFVERGVRSTSTSFSMRSASIPGDVYEVKVEKTLKHLFRIYTRLKATEALGRALHGLYTILARLGHLTKPLRPYSSDHLRFELRMRPFLGLSVPEPVDFESFQLQTSLPGLTDLEVLEGASRAIGEARKAWDAVLKGKWYSEVFIQDSKPHQTSLGGDGGVKSAFTAGIVEEGWTKDVKDTLRACIATSIAIGTVKKMVEDSSGGNVTAGPFHRQAGVIKVRLPAVGEKDCWHQWWIVPKITN